MKEIVKEIFNCPPQFDKNDISHMDYIFLENKNSDFIFERHAALLITRLFVHPFNEITTEILFFASCYSKKNHCVSMNNLTANN